mmetsp:Transcript_6309/g.11914  ORF Transcript_6309/g.11914 Transcript_6309/m.11914 type:complete len:130 (-) Transcript_6309:2-391(-)
MFLFSGTCLHGGATFLSTNCRVHMTYVRKEVRGNVSKDNDILLVYTCPDKDCSYNSGERVKTVTLAQLQDHWRYVHRKKHRLTLSQFQKSLEGCFIATCEKCGRTYSNKRSFERHLKSSCSANANENDE